MLVAGVGRALLASAHCHKEWVPRSGALSHWCATPGREPGRGAGARREWGCAGGGSAVGSAGREAGARRDWRDGQCLRDCGIGGWTWVAN